MAISLDVIEAKGVGNVDDKTAPVMEMPLSNFTRVTAAGATTLTEGTRVVRLRNKVGADPVWFRVQLVADTTQAGSTNGILLEAGKEFDFALPRKKNASLYELDVRVAS